MARKPRIHLPGAVYHVIIRGNCRQDIFIDDKDRYHFYRRLEASCKRFDHRIHAFCLMTNHVHLQIQVGQIPLSRMMQSVTQGYTQWFNCRHSRSGHLFQGRYKAILVDSDEYLLELASYIHLNPVRAGITDKPENYRWSSHRAYLGRESLSWLETSFVLSQFSDGLKQSQKLFSIFVNERLLEGHRDEFHGGKTMDSRVVGSDGFVEVVLAEVESVPVIKPDVRTVVEAVQRLYQISETRICSQSQERVGSEARAVAAWATLELSNGTLAELGKCTGRSASSLTCAVRRLEKRREQDPMLVERMKQLQMELSVLPAVNIKS